MKKITHSPWGAVQHQSEIADGITQVSTASHGGLVLSDERLQAMPEQYKINNYGGGRYFEEDCEWALVCLAFPEAFSAEHHAAAIATARMFYKSLAV